MKEGKGRQRTIDKYRIEIAATLCFSPLLFCVGRFLLTRFFASKDHMAGAKDTQVGIIGSSLSAEKHLRKNIFLFLAYFLVGAG